MMLALALSTLLFAAPADVAPFPTPGSWPVSTPTEQGLDAQRLETLAERIRTGEYPYQHSLLVVKNGYLVFEQYFNGSGKDDVHTLQSVSKSVTSALVGIAIGEEKISGVDETVLGGFFSERDVDDERRAQMTLEDLLTMRSGNDYDEKGADSPHFQLNRLRTGWTEFILDRPMVREPGTHFQYDSGAVILTSELIRRRTGVHAHEYAKTKLFEPLGITTTNWFCNQDGHPHAGGGLDMRARDMARFGLLYLRNGKWGDDQVVPEAWVEASIQKRVTFDDRSAPQSIGYGYWWWIFDPAEGDTEPYYAGMGFMGQYIFVVPEHDLVVVATAGAQGRAQNAARNYLYSDILPAVLRPESGNE